MATEKRLIDANEAKRRIIAFATGCHSEVLSVDSIIMMLNQSDTVDAVEVVRCKDCKHYMTIHCTCDGCCISDNWYCADGERRTDG